MSTNRETARKTDGEAETADPTPTPPTGRSTDTTSTGTAAPEGTLLARVQAHRRETDGQPIARDAPQRDQPDASPDRTPPESTSPASPRPVRLLAKAAGVAFVGGLVCTSLLAAFIGTVSGGVAWTLYVLTGLGTVALWRHYSARSNGPGAMEANR